eukprot:gene26414-35062_t
MDISLCCKSSQQDIKRDYPELLLAETCPGCGVKICFHNNLPQQLPAGKCIVDGLPPLKKLFTTSQGSTIPAEVDHASCERLVRTDFYLYEVPETVKQHPSRIWGEGEDEIKYSTESDLVSFVRIFLRDIISAMCLGLNLFSDLSIKHLAPDICVMTSGERLVGVIEVKKCGTNNILIQPTVLGELFDQMLLVEGLYFSGPVIGILTTFEEWMLAWFVADDKHFTCETNSGTAAVKVTVFATPTTKPTDSAQDSSPPGSQLSAESHFIGEEVEDEDEEEILAGELQLLCGDRTLTTTRVFNSKEDFEILLEHVYTAFRRMSEYHICNGKIVNVDATNPPYRRLLAWRTRKCIMEHQHLIPPGEVEGWIHLCNFSEQSRSIAQETDDAEVEAAESGSSCLKEG